MIVLFCSVNYRNYIQAIDFIRTCWLGFLVGLIVFRACHSAHVKFILFFYFIFDSCLLRVDMLQQPLENFQKLLKPNLYLISLIQAKCKFRKKKMHPPRLPAATARPPHLLLSPPIPFFSTTFPCSPLPARFWLPLVACLYHLVDSQPLLADLFSPFLHSLPFPFLYPAKALSSLGHCLQ